MSQKKNTRSNDLLLGVFIGLYCNWIIYLGQILVEKSQQFILFGNSMVFFFGLCLAFTRKNIKLEEKVLGSIGIIHIVLLIASFIYEIKVSNFSVYTSITLIFFWMFFLH